MDKIITIRDAMEGYGLSRRKATELFSRCKQIPRVPRGKRMVLESEFSKVLTGGRK